MIIIIINITKLILTIQLLFTGDPTGSHSFSKITVQYIYYLYSCDKGISFNN